MAPTVVSAIETSVIGPIPASDVGRLKIPTPMMLPMISAIATGSPKPPPAAAPGPVPSGWDWATAAPDGGREPASPVRSDGVSAMAHSLSVIDCDSLSPIGDEQDGHHPPVRRCVNLRRALLPQRD